MVVMVADTLPYKCRFQAMHASCGW